MSAITLIGTDTIKINNRLLTDFASGEKFNAGSLNFPNELVTIKTGKSGGSTYALNENGQQCEVVLNLTRGSSDDCFLNALLSLMKSDFPSFTLLTGEIVKRAGSGGINGSNTNAREDIYILSGGVFTKEVDTQENDGTATWNLRFNSAPRSIM